MGVRGVLLLVVVELWGLGGLLVAAVPPPPLPIRPILLRPPPPLPLSPPPPSPRHPSPLSARSVQQASQPASPVWLAGRLAGQLACWSPAWLREFLSRSLAGWLVGWLHLEGFLATRIDFQVGPLKKCPKVLQKH